MAETELTDLEEVSKKQKNMERIIETMVQKDDSIKALEDEWHAGVMKWADERYNIAYQYANKIVSDMMEPKYMKNDRWQVSEFRADIAKECGKRMGADL
eukprot:4934547-Amphidinium_carterae.1